MDDINVQLIDMDVMIPEQVSRNADGSYTIFLNTRLTQERRFQSYQHALQHIAAGDFDYENRSVQEIEARAHAVQKDFEQEKCSKESETKYANALSRIRRRKKALKKQIREYEKDMIILERIDPNKAFDRAEHQWLYGNDL